MCHICTLKLDMEYDKSKMSLDPSVYKKVSIVQWAEDGEVPFKAERRAEWHELQEQDAETLQSVALMFSHYEQLLHEKNLYMYFPGFGIKEMFESLEFEMRLENWYTREENVGLPGLSMVLSLNANFFAPLYVEDEDED